MAEPQPAQCAQATQPAEAVAQPAAYSFTRISTFDQCARRFRYRYLDQVKEAFESVEGFMGKQVHACIEWLFGEREAGRSPAAAQVVRRYCDEWDARIASAPRSVRVVRRDRDLESYRRTGAEIVAQFHRDRFVGDQLETIECEKHFDVLLGERFRFQGFIDRLARDRWGRLHVIDYKTGRNVPRQFCGKEADQVEAYALAMFRETDADAVELVLEFLRAGKVLRSRLDRARAADVEAHLMERMESVERTTVFPPSPGALCDWCGYNDICDGYGARVRAAISA